MKALRRFRLLKKVALMHKLLAFAALIFWSSGSVAQQPLIEPCAGMEGYASVLCHKNIQEQQQQALAQTLAQPQTLPAGSESNGSQPGVPNISCGDAYSPQWDNCVGLARFENGNVYRGEFHHGLREGLGFLMVNGTGASDHDNIRSNDGPAIYAGEFRGGRLNGHGVWFTKSGAGYSGTFIDNIAQSDVSHTNCRGALSPSWNDCVARISYENGSVYYGEYMYGRREGIGMFEIHETGTSDETSIRTPAAGFYVGEFSGDRLNGQGMIFMPGAGFYGTFTNNILNTPRPGN
jgi:hypothetical protein